MNKIVVAAVISSMLLAVVPGAGQSVAPPISEYRGKAEGMFEVKNDSDVAMATIVEVQGFTISENGTLQYSPPNPKTRVELGSNSFVIPPHQSHLVFYKAQTEEPNCWFTLLSTMTRAVPLRGQMRINFVLPHVVYLYQKQKLRMADVSVRVLEGENVDGYSIEVQNHTQKLGRVENVSCEGFSAKADSGGFPLFPMSKRLVRLSPGAPSANAAIKVSFQDGFSIRVPLDAGIPPAAAHE